MNLKLLNKYLQDVEQGMPVNLVKFSGLLSQLSLAHDFKPSDINARKISGQLYRVTDINEELMNELQNLVKDLGNDRISAAKQNRSHNHKVLGSLLVIRKGLQHPNVVIFNECGNFDYIENISQSALLIENRQNFISIERTLLFLQEFTQLVDININELDIIFAEGNEVSNSLHKSFLESYDTLYLFFDLDLGGLTIAKNLYSLLPNQSISFLVPSDINKRLNSVVEIQQAEYLKDVITIGRECPQLARYSKLIKDNKRILEQESFLYGK